MSYSATISFKSLEGNDIYSFFQEFKRKTTEKIPEIAESNYIFSPFAKEKYKGYDDFEMNERARNWAVTYVFRYRFFYLPEHNLLGVFGVPKAVWDIFDLTHDFGDGGDSDYEFDSWNGIPAFEKIAAKWENTSDEDIEKLYGEDIDNFDYHRRSYAYDEIWKLFSNFLDNDEEAVHLSLFCQWDVDPINKFIHYCKKNYQKFLDEFKKPPEGTVGNWINITDRRPEKEGRYWCQWKLKDNDEIVEESLNFGGNKFFIEVALPNSEVIAWKEKEKK